MMLGNLSDFQDAQVRAAAALLASSERPHFLQSVSNIVGSAPTDAAVMNAITRGLSGYGVSAPRSVPIKQTQETNDVTSKNSLQRYRNRR
jgi:hypothetical protein